jgi:DeoR/GlpR family transcriptional regulator of sugar metabolism
MHDTPPSARRSEIAERLARGQTVVASLLATEFRTSDDAIRRDLRALANDGLCRRVYGGAMPVHTRARPMVERVNEGQSRKRALAKAALALIQPQEYLFLDNGSTNLELARLLPDELELTVATNSVDIAALLIQRTGVQTIIVGGLVHPVVGGSVDPSACESIARMNIDRCFVGVCALSAACGISAFDSGDASFKRALLHASRERTALVTTDKFAARAPHRITPLGGVQTYILEHDAPVTALEELLAVGVSVLQAEPA